MLRHVIAGLALGLAAMPALAEEPSPCAAWLVPCRRAHRRISGSRCAIVRMPGGPPSKLTPTANTRSSKCMQYFLPQNPKGKLPLLMWHGGGLTGATYETTPDGREGWLNTFIRKGWDTYISDAVERGRSGFASADVWPGEPIFLTQADPFERFRIGAGEGSWNADPANRKVLPGNQFPVEAYESYMKQIVPRWLATDAAVIAGYIALVDKVCPCVLLLHSQSGSFGMKVAEARPDKVKAIVAVEPASAGNLDKAAALKDIPVLMMFGDYVDSNPRWSAFRKIDLDYAAAVRTAGGTVDVINLPEIGINCNSHMIMMDKNSAEVADVIQKWLVGKGLVEQ
jgi:pimeloyl-ACP methyl ester carboxylesterase